jgi:hypothetical protein
MPRLSRFVLALAVLASAALSACSSPPPVDDGRSGIPDRLDRASRAQDELSRESSGR